MQETIVLATLDCYVQIVTLKLLRIRQKIKEMEEAAEGCRGDNNSPVAQW